MSSIMRRRSGLMAISVIGGSCLEDEVANPQSSGRDAARHHQLLILLQPLTSSSATRAALSRESGFVHCLGAPGACPGRGVPLRPRELPCARLLERTLTGSLPA